MTKSTLIGITFIQIMKPELFSQPILQLVLATVNYGSLLLLSVIYLYSLFHRIATDIPYSLTVCTPKVSHDNSTIIVFLMCSLKYVLRIPH